MGARNDGPESLGGRVAIVTGGSSGIGRAVCVALARRGAALVVVGRSPTRLQETGDALAALAPERGRKRRALLLRLDVRSEADMESMRDRTLDRFGRIDVLVASAGIGRAGDPGRRLPTPFVRLPLSQWDAVVDTNLRGVFLSNRAVLPPMIERGRGEIVNIASARGSLRGQAYAAAYCASKFALLAFSRALAAEVASAGIRVQTVLPDAVESPLVAGTGLGAPRFGSLPPARLGEFVADSVALPDDATLESPLVAPFARAGRTA
jgi:NAD(P)-dependent dehydrogenase (short-subunit alcohol dehydrogenase family)